MSNNKRMTTRIVVLMLVWHAGAVGVAAAPATLRVDYDHTGNDKEEIFSLDRPVVEPLPWAGNPAQPIDATKRGKYFSEASDVARGRVSYPRGFSAISG